MHVQVLSLLESDPSSCEAQLTLFSAAADSYKHDSLLRPFPKEFHVQGRANERDIEELVRKHWHHHHTYNNMIHYLYYMCLIYSLVAQLSSLSARRRGLEAAAGQGRVHALQSRETPALGEIKSEFGGSFFLCRPHGA